MAQWFRVLTALLADSGSIPRTLVVAYFQSSIALVLGDSVPSSDPHGYGVNIHACTGNGFTHINLKKNVKSK